MNPTALPYRLLTAIAWFLLLVPNILFLFGWCHTWIALPISLLLLVSGFLVWRHLPPVHVSWKRKDMLCLLILFLGCIFATESLGFLGQTKQSGDFIVRNAFYQTLIRDSWPLFNADGSYVVYYLTYWLPPAALSKLVRAVNPHIILHLWTLLYFCTLFGLFFIRFKRKTVLLMGIIFIVGPLYEYVELPVILNELSARVPWIQSLYDLSTPLIKHAYGMRYDNLWRQLACNTFNNALPVATVFALLLAARPKPAAVLHYSALIFSSSPLSAIALLPYLTMRHLPQLKRSRDWLRMALSDFAVPAALLLLVCVVTYLSSTNDASQTHFLWQASAFYHWHEQSVLYRAIRYGIILFLTAIPAWFFLHHRFRRTAEFRSSLLLMVFLPLVWVGYENNELLFKGSMVLFLCLSVLYMLAFRYCRKRMMRIALLIFFAASSICFIVNFGRFYIFYTWEPEKMKANINNEWEGHLYHLGHMYYSRFVGKPSCPAILKTPGDTYR